MSTSACLLQVFGSVEMLYVNMEINGVAVKTFVDSGAQMTIMTFDFAEKCFLSHLIDKRFQGMAIGVGSSKIVGRIHQVGRGHRVCHGFWKRR